MIAVLLCEPSAVCGQLAAARNNFKALNWVCAGGM
jgi:hypothetical protein